MHHSDFIALLASIYKPKIYLELGLYEGETWYKTIPHCAESYGVDIEDKKIKGNIFIESTENFFKHFNKNIDMAFIDADHSYESVKIDFFNCFSRLNDGGFILLHDTDPIKNELISPYYCGDCYRIVNELENNNNLNITTFPITEAGLSIITKKRDTRTIKRLK